MRFPSVNDVGKRSVRQTSVKLARSVSAGRVHARMSSPSPGATVKPITLPGGRSASVVKDCEALTVELSKSSSASIVKLYAVASVRPETIPLCEVESAEDVAVVTIGPPLPSLTVTIPVVGSFVVHEIEAELV